MRRIGLLHLVIGLLVVLAGCAIPFSSQTETQAPTLGSVEVRNHDDQPHTLDILIEQNGTIAYWTTVHVAAKRNDELGSTVIVPGRFVEQPGEYVIKTRLENQSTGQQFQLSSDADAACYVVQIRIADDATIVFGTMKGAYECKTV